ncbi:MAG TPA: GNAT family N-acetyltransferase [Saprospiraceae bacterium]|mgnify:CR=1 FL=1|nr:GNAT family N-acetyltransferase [Saprospiraceae bacterium]
MNDEVEIIHFSDELKEHIKTLNYEWLEKYFHIEPGDEYSLSNPREAIIDKGGYIFYAKYGDEIVGTASLLKKSEDVFELGKMAVTDRVRGKGIGTILLEYCLDFAKEKEIPKLILYSNTRLTSALHIYKKYGFVEIPLETGLYERADIKLEKVL